MKNTEKNKNIKLEITKEELKIMTGIMMLIRMGGFKDLHKDWYPVVSELAEKLSLLDIRQNL